MATGAKFTCCHPDAVSLVKVAEARLVPVLVNRCPTGVPLLVLALWRRMPVMVPATSAVNFTPISTGLSGPPSTPTGVAVLGQMVQLVVHGDPEPPTDTVTPAEGISRFPLSSTARLLIVTEPDVPEVFQL